MYNQSVGTASPSIKQTFPSKEEVNGSSARSSTVTHSTTGGPSQHPGLDTLRAKAVRNSASFRIRASAGRRVHRRISNSNDGSCTTEAYGPTQEENGDEAGATHKLVAQAGFRLAGGQDDVQIEMDDGLDAVSENSSDVSEMTSGESDDEDGHLGPRKESQEDVGDDSDALRWKSKWRE